MIEKLSKDVHDVSERMGKIEALLPMILEHMKKQTDILENMAVYQERTSSLGRRVGSMEEDLRDFRKEIVESKLEIKANTVKVLLGSTLIIAVITMSLKEYFS